VSERNESNKTKNDIAWEILFDRHNILERIEQGKVFHISASAINQEREARLMTKFDHSDNLPEIFQLNGLAILPDTRSSYIIGRFDCYAKLPQFKREDVNDASMRDGIETITIDNLYSEVASMLCAQHAGLINDVLEEEVFLTVFGRMTTDIFDFQINEPRKKGTEQRQIPIKVSKAQIEIDGGYEGDSLFAVLEVKNQYVRDFNVRQLFYPYRLWSEKLAKPVIPVLLTYSNEVFSFYVYRFMDSRKYNSLELVKHKHFQIVPMEIGIADVRRILQQASISPEPVGIPFPQADVFARVLDLLTQLYKKTSLTQEDITTNYDFNVRQSQYYADAARYLGLVEKEGEHGRTVTYSLSRLGLKIMNKHPRARNLALIQQILSKEIFKRALDFYLANSTLPSKSDIAQIMQEMGLELNETTIGRRASTVRGWLRWIINLTVSA
jgi:hypothetical protein